MDTFDKRVVRITGGTEDARTQKEQEFWNIQTEKRKKYEQYAQEPTERQREIIHIARQGVDQIIRGYGGDPSQSPEYRIFLIPHPAFTELDTKFPGSFISHFNQSILIELENSDVSFALSIARELFHARSPEKIHVDLDRDRTALLSGASYDTGRGEYKRRLLILEEALVSNLIREFYDTIVRNRHLFQDDLSAIDTITVWGERLCERAGIIDPQAIALLKEELWYFPHAISHAQILESDQSDEKKFEYLTGVVNGLREAGLFDTSNRYEERQKLNTLMDDIASRSSGEFSDRHAVFEVLVNAAFTSDWSPAIRMIERTLGRPAVRRIVKDFSGRINDHVAQEQEKEENKEGI